MMTAVPWPEFGVGFEDREPGGSPPLGPDGRHRDTARAAAAGSGDDWGRSESFDPDNVGDIADEGAGHRG
jgi:hypothetical protein